MPSAHYLPTHLPIYVLLTYLGTYDNILHELAIENTEQSGIDFLSFHVPGAALKLPDQPCNPDASLLSREMLGPSRVSLKCKGRQQKILARPKEGMGLSPQKLPESYYEA
jgi:hypothetical protein